MSQATSHRSDELRLAQDFCRLRRRIQREHPKPFGPNGFNRQFNLQVEAWLEAERLTWEQYYSIASIGSELEALPPGHRYSPWNGE